LPSSGKGQEVSQTPFFSSFFSEPKNHGQWGSHIQTFPAHTQIYQQGESADTLYLIERGLVKLTRLAPNGREIIAGIRRRHWLIGTTAVLLRGEYTYTAIALVRTSLRCIPANVFLNLVKMNSQLSWQLNLSLSREVINHRKRLEANSCMAAKDSLKSFLCELIQEQEQDEPGSPSRFHVPLKSHELAEIVAVTPEHLCRLLKEMEQDQIVRREKGMLVVNDPAALLRKAET
jgi:CRP/FNR family cyclic AMP-dependent transcriptional regulator